MKCKNNLVKEKKLGCLTSILSSSELCSQGLDIPGIEISRARNQLKCKYEGGGRKFIGGAFPKCVLEANNLIIHFYRT